MSSIPGFTEVSIFVLRECHSSRDGRSPQLNAERQQVSSGQTGSGLARCVAPLVRVRVSSCIAWSCFHPCRLHSIAHSSGFLLDEPTVHPTPTCRFFNLKTRWSHRINSSPFLLSSAILENDRFPFGSLNRRWTDLSVKDAA